MKLQVLSPAYYPTLDQCKYLTSSCEKFGLDLELYGASEPFTTLRQVKVVDLYRKLKKLTANYILVCDSADVVICGSESDILDSFFQFDQEVIFSAEKNCYPEIALSSSYPFTFSPWKFLNSGMFIGERSEILKMTEKLTEDPFLSNYNKYFDNDQWQYSKLYLNSHPKYGLDEDCILFQNMHQITHQQEIDSEALIFHFNGNQPGIKEFYEKCVEQQTIQ